MSRGCVALVVGVLALAGCSVEVVDGRPVGPSTPGADVSAPAAEGDRDAGDTGPVDTAPATTGPTTTGPATTATAGDGAVGGSLALPGRDDLRAGIAGSMTCGGGGDGGTALAGAAVEVTDDCATLTVGGAGSVVVARDVDHLVVTGAGSQVALHRVGTVTISAADVTVTWEDGSPDVTDGGAASVYGLAGSR